MPMQDTDSVVASWGIHGHDNTIRMLQSLALAQSGLHHAYLFLGSEQVGKRTVAYVFARALLCTDETQRPCNNCRACHLMLNENHPDFRVIQPIDRTHSIDRVAGMLRVEQASELTREASLRPLEGQYKVFLLQDMQKANDSFANKLLKMLEEPPQHVLLLLTAPNRASLLSTIVSRCQVFFLHPVNVAIIEEALIEDWQAVPEQAQVFARLANGRFGWAVDQIENSKNWENRFEQLESLWRLSSSGRIQRLAFAKQLAAHRDDQQLFSMIHLWMAWWRDVMLMQSGYIDACSNIDQRSEIIRQAQLVQPSCVQNYIQTLKQVEEYLRHTTNVRLVLDVLLLQLPKLHI